MYALTPLPIYTMVQFMYGTMVQLIYHGNTMLYSTRQFRTTR